MKYWWVNQKKTHKQEIPGGFLWSPKIKANGARNQFWDNMTLMEVGDVVFSYYNGEIKTVGVVTEPAQTAIKPDFGKAGENWSSDGCFVKAEFKPLVNPIRPKEHAAVLLPLMPEKYAPLKENGDGREFYLTELPETFAKELERLIGSEVDVKVAQLTAEIDLLSELAVDTAVEEALIGRTDIGPTTKSQLVKSRRGQGIFKSNVRLNEKGCRITGISNIKHLIASHIKPWSESSDTEKLNGCNGLLLAPHVDHLFNNGMIGFSDNGDLIISTKLDKDILCAWKIDEVLNVGKFKEEQKEFLRYHRQKFNLPS
jgi:putative restriction endonuclease